MNPRAGCSRSGILFIVGFLVLVSGLLVSCRQKSETDIIGELLAEMAAATESRDAAALSGHLADNYHDFQGRDREETVAMIENYFERFRGIVIHVLSSRIVLEDGRNAAVETDVSLSSGAARAFRKLIRFSGENYRFHCRLSKNERWQVTQAKWEFIEVDSLFPESLKILRELFPDL